ncbi:hypothetical protein HDV06_004113 [Boothiomyces sp. JEL0866]|nr:hypothetical protein HDV06_007094 [Boothiomyces sp. JEL0866]KAJ3321577.1 hypothetical protein HDV06_004113 [Boothiomyces sp. JEL0866]
MLKEFLRKIENGEGESSRQDVRLSLANSKTEISKELLYGENIMIGNKKLNGYLAVVPSDTYPNLNEDEIHELTVSSSQDPREGRARATFQLERAFLEDKDKRVRFGESFYIKITLPKVAKPLYLNSVGKSFYTHKWNSIDQQAYLSFKKGSESLWKFEWADYHYRMEMEFKPVRPGDEGILTHIHTANHLCGESNPHLVNRSEYGAEAPVVCRSIKDFQNRSDKGYNFFSFNVNAGIVRLAPKRSFFTSRPWFAITPFNLADIGEGISEVEVIQWFVKPGDNVEEFSKICEVQSDKAAVEISSRYEGKILKLYHEVGGIAKVGAPLVDIETDEAVETQSPPEKETPKPAAPSAPVSAEAHPVRTDLTDKQTFATPAVRRIAKENSVDIRQVTGTGPQGRILKGDILAFVNGEQKPAAAPAKKTSTGQDITKPLTPIQKAMFKSMTKSLSIPHFGFSDEIEIDAMAKFRAEINSYLKSSKGKHTFEKISYMPIFLKAMSQALLDFPILNAQVVNADTTPALLYRHSHNIGIAMDTPQGLIVPNVKDVQDKSILEIAADLEVLKNKGKAGQISNSDLQNGTITLSNVGNIGGTLLHPVLVSSEVCIGAIGKVQKLPRFETVNGIETVVSKQIINVSFNADHRVIDGATVARFVQLWKNYLEHPNILTANLK